MSSTNPPTGAAFPPTGPPGIPSQTPMVCGPPPNIQGLPFYPPLGPPFLYGHPGPNGGQYHAAGQGVNTPQLYYAPPYPPFSQHSNAGPWGYGHYPPGAFTGPVPQPGDLLHGSDPVRVNQTQARTVGATDKTAPAEFRPKRIYPNKLLREGGTSHSDKKKATLPLTWTCSVVVRGGHL
jgi:hypothetical protein